MNEDKDVILNPDDEDENLEPTPGDDVEDNPEIKEDDTDTTEKIGYLSIDEADIFITSHFLSSAEERLQWDELTNADKKVLLTLGFEDIENNVFIGYKTYENQENQFPRNGSDEVPADIIKAQIYEAIEIGFGDTTGYDAVSRGIKSETIGKISTSYFTNAFSTFSNMSIKSSIARKLLYKYLKRVYLIC